ncbi:MAG: ABC transporter substrate-binding protein, partial [Acidaminococcaceae bacterium]|nr:ABC transporter substrate-binding protein [Acidaminococcaceae bacterium]
MKKSLLMTLVAFIACAALVLTGCANKTKSDEKKAATPSSLKITYVKSPLNIPSIIDKNNQTIANSFAKNNTKVSFPDINSGAKQTEALAAGSLDICSA